MSVTISSYHTEAFSQICTTAYRFGFQGQEKDDEIKGSGNSVFYKQRIYDPRIGKFLSVDPLTKEYAWYTPYQFAGNKPIAFVDRDGEEEARPDEIVHALLNVIDAIAVDGNRAKAIEAASNSGLPISGARDGRYDVFRHAYWNALNARDIGSHNAEPFATLHETGSNANDPNHPHYDPLAIEMDLFNNAAGREIGQSNSDLSDKDLADKVMDALNNGELKVIDPTGTTTLEGEYGKTTGATVSGAVVNSPVTVPLADPVVTPDYVPGESVVEDYD